MKYQQIIEKLDWFVEDGRMTPCDVGTIKDLLAQKEDKIITDRGSSQSGVALTPKVRPLTIKDTKWTGCSTPSPLEIEKLTNFTKRGDLKLGYLKYEGGVVLADKINEIIDEVNNQKKLYQYIKDKK